MNLKYYLRGLGIGIAVTAVVMGFSMNNKTIAMTDEQIIEKAQSLGMVMEDKVLIKQPSNTDKPMDDSKPEAVKEDTEADKEAEAANEAVLAEEEAAAKKKAEEEAAAKKKAEEEAAAKKKAEEEAEAKKKAEEEAAAKKKAEEEAEAKKKAEEEAAAKKKAEEEAAKKAAENSVKANGQSVTITVDRGLGSESVAALLYNAGLVDSATTFNAYLCSGGYDRRLTTGPHNVPVGASYAEIARIMTQ